MRYLDKTLEYPEENLAIEELLLDWVAESNGGPVLRFWESASPFVVLGLGCNADDDVDRHACNADGVPVFRRASGGGTVLQGPGCLSYALILPHGYDARLVGIHSTNEFVLERIAMALRPFHPDIAYRGISDLTLGDFKVSGNAQRRKRHTVLFHGTLLYGMDPALIAKYLRLPKRQPDYRGNRPHQSFLRNLTVPPAQMKAAIREEWGAQSALNGWPEERLLEYVEKVRGRQIAP